MVKMSDITMTNTAPSEPRRRSTLYMHVRRVVHRLHRGTSANQSIDSYHFVAREETFGLNRPPQVYGATLQHADSRQVVALLQPLLASHPGGERAIGKVVVKPIPCFLAPRFLRFLREKDIAVEFDDDMTFGFGRSGRPLRPLQEHNYAQR